MTRSEVKSHLREAYDVAPSDRKLAFLRQCRRRELNYTELILMQFRYMGAQLLFVLIYALLMFMGALFGMDEDVARVVSAATPVSALAASTGLWRSERYGMNELEMASRLSLRMIAIMRLSIIGAGGTVVMISAACLMKAQDGADMVFSLAFVGVPFMLTSAACMRLIRRWHSSRNIYGCVGISALIGGLTLVAQRPFLECRAETIKIIMIALLAASMLWTAREAAGIIRESEELQWNCV